MSYDVETTGDGGGDGDAGMGAMPNAATLAPNELIELNISYEDADQDIRSIMMSNDKLMNQLASSVATVAAAETLRQGSDKTMVAAGQASQQQSSKRQGGALMARDVADELDDLGQAEDYDQSASSSAAEEGAAAKTLGLLDSLVRRTIDEDYATQGSKGVWSGQLELSQQQAQDWPAVRAE